MRYYLCDFVLRAFLVATGQDPNYLTSPPASDDEDTVAIGSTTVERPVETDLHRRSVRTYSDSRGPRTGSTENPLTTEDIQSSSQSSSHKESLRSGKKPAKTEEGQSFVPRMTETVSVPKKEITALLINSNSTSPEPGNTKKPYRNGSGSDPGIDTGTITVLREPRSSSIQTKMGVSNRIAPQELKPSSLCAQGAQHIFPARSELDSLDLSFTCPPNSPEEGPHTAVRNLPIESLLTPAVTNLTAPSTPGEINREAGPAKPSGQKCRRGRRGGRSRGRNSSTTPSTIQSPVPPEKPVQPSTVSQVQTKPSTSKAQPQSKRVLQKQRQDQTPQSENLKFQKQPEGETEDDKKIHVEKDEDNLAGKHQGEAEEQGRIIKENVQVKDIEENETRTSSAMELPVQSWSQQQKWSSDESWSSKPVGTTKNWTVSQPAVPSDENEESTFINEPTQQKPLIEESEPVTKFQENTELKQQSDNTQHSESSSARRLRLNPHAPEFKPDIPSSSAGNNSNEHTNHNPTNLAVSSVSASASASASAFASTNAFRQAPHIVPDVSAYTQEIAFPSRVDGMAQREVISPYEVRSERDPPLWSQNGDPRFTEIVGNPLSGALSQQAQFSHLPTTAVAPVTPHLNPYSTSFRTERYAVNSTPLPWVQPTGAMFPPVNTLSQQQRTPKPLTILPASPSPNALTEPTHPTTKPSPIRSRSPTEGPVTYKNSSSAQGFSPAELRLPPEGSQRKLSSSISSSMGPALNSSSEYYVVPGASTSTSGIVPTNGSVPSTQSQSRVMLLPRSDQLHVPGVGNTPVSMKPHGPSGIPERYRPPIPQESGWEQLFGDTTPRRAPYNGSRQMAFYGDESFGAMGKTKVRIRFTPAKQATITGVKIEEGTARPSFRVFSGIPRPKRATAT